MPKITDLYPLFAVTERPWVTVCVDGNPSTDETWALLTLARTMHAKTALDLGTFNGNTAVMLADVVEKVWTVETDYWPRPEQVLPLPANVTQLATVEEFTGGADLVLVMVKEDLLPAAFRAAGERGLVVWHAGTAQRLAAGLDGYKLYQLSDRMAVVKPADTNRQN
jgi:hypothetical protein